MIYCRRANCTHYSSKEFIFSFSFLYDVKPRKGLFYENVVQEPILATFKSKLEILFTWEN